MLTKHANMQGLFSVGLPFVEMTNTTIIILKVRSYPLHSQTFRLTDIPLIALRCLDRRRMSMCTRVHNSTWCVIRTRKHLLNNITKRNDQNYLPTGLSILQTCIRASAP